VEIVINPTPFASRNSVKLYTVTAGNVKLLIPGAANGWHLVSTPDDGSSLLRLSNVDGTSLIAINVRNGDMYWSINTSGVGFDEVQMRLTKDGAVTVIDRDVLRAAYGDAANVPVYVLESIEVTPEATPVPTDTPAATATPAR
jgi:hypothetical protein